MARQQTLADEIAERLPKSEAKFVDDDEFVYFYPPRQLLSRAAGRPTSASSTRFKNQTDAEHDEVVVGGRAAHRRDGATRSAPDRQPAPRRAPAARATPARRASICRSKTT